MKVYVAEHGLYSSKGVGGVYDSPERAMADCHKPGMKWTKTTGEDRGRSYAWWENDKDWEEAVLISAYDLVTEGPVRSADFTKGDTE